MTTGTMLATVHAVNDSTKAGGKVHFSKNQLRRAKAKQKKSSTPVRNTNHPHPSQTERPLSQENSDNPHPNGDVQMDDARESENVEYVSEPLDVKGTALEAFSDIFARFQLPSGETAVRNNILPIHASAANYILLSYKDERT